MNVKCSCKILISRIQIGNKQKLVIHFICYGLISYKLVYKKPFIVILIKKDVLKMSSKFSYKHSCRSVVSIKSQSNFIEITFPHRCSPVNLLHIFRIPFSMNTSRGLLLVVISWTELLQGFLIRKILILQEKETTWRMKKNKNSSFL